VNGYEEIIVDTELDGSRYLPVRMPRRTGTPVTLSPREQEIVRIGRAGSPEQGNRRRPEHQLVDGRHAPAAHLRQARCRIARAMVARFGAMALRVRATG